MTFKKLLVASAIALSGSVALAGGVNYDYAQTGYVDYNDALDVGADGFSIDLSKEFADNWYGRLDYTDVSFDGVGVDADILRLNIGYKTAVSDSTDFIAELGYEDINIDIFSENGYNALIGFRGMVSDNFELGAYAQYSDEMESTDLTLEGRYHINDSFSMGVEFGNDEELDEHYGINVRFNF